MSLNIGLNRMLKFSVTYYVKHLFQGFFHFSFAASSKAVFNIYFEPSAQSILSSMFRSSQTCAVNASGKACAEPTV